MEERRGEGGVYAGDVWDSSYEDDDIVSEG